MLLTKFHQFSHDYIRFFKDKKDNSSLKVSPFIKDFHKVFLRVWPLIYIILYISFGFIEIIEGIFNSNRNTNCFWIALMIIIFGTFFTNVNFMNVKKLTNNFITVLRQKKFSSYTFKNKAIKQRYHQIKCKRTYIRLRLLLFSDQIQTQMSLK